VFPLADAVLFPHVLLPLHIFEPRYRALIRDVLDTHKLMVVARLLEEEKIGQPPPRFAAIAGVGEVVLAQELPDGRFNIVLRGCARVHVEAELPSAKDYRVVVARELPDGPVWRTQEMVEAEFALRALAMGVANALPEGGELLKHVTSAQTTPNRLADVLAASLVSDADIRQSLLETTDVLVRLECVLAELASHMGRLSSDRQVN
jgi:Lon protease-like protein